METRTIHDAELGDIILSIDAEELRIVLSIPRRNAPLEVGFSYNDPSTLAARYVQLTDDDVRRCAHQAVDELYGEENPTIH